MIQKIESNASEVRSNGNFLLRVQFSTKATQDTHIHFHGFLPECVV